MMDDKKKPGKMLSIALIGSFAVWLAITVAIWAEMIWKAAAAGGGR